MNILYMLMGIPGSGKSAFREKQFSGDYAEHISTDDVIQKIATLFDLTYDDCFQDCFKFAEAQILSQITKAINKNRLIVWDQTNLTRKSREKKLALFKDSSYKRIIYVFPTPDPEELKRRLYKRPGKTIPPKILQSMIKSFEYPVLEEGFDEIRNYDGDL